MRVVQKFSLCFHLVIIWTIGCVLSKNVGETLHEFMSKPELEYYFGAENDNVAGNYEIVYLPVITPNELESDVGNMYLNKEPTVDDVPLQYDFNAFGRNIKLQLVPNRKLIAPSFKLFRKDESGTTLLRDNLPECHFLHKDDEIVAAFSSCGHDSVDGLVFLGNSTLEIRPLTTRLRSLIKLREALIESSDESTDETNKIPHIVKRATFDSKAMYDDVRLKSNSVWNEPDIIDVERRKRSLMYSGSKSKFGYNYNIKKRASSKMTVEVGVFFDEAGYKLFAPYMGNNDKRVRDMLLAYMNAVHAIYQHPSLGTNIDIVIVRMDLMKTQPKNLPHYNGERSKLLDSFCDYQKSINPSGDNNPNHWDMALYVSGLDFYAIENGRKSGVTMGLATVGGVCLDKYACVIAELGTTNAFGKPYPSAGFTSVYIMAHEIGHNLGMHHDSSGNNCPKEGYIMSPSRGTNGETLWSSCSAQVMRDLSWAKCLFDSPKKPGSKELDHSRFLNTPGQNYGVKKQCEILLRDKDAVMLPSQQLSTICENLQCKTPHRSGFYFAGPALEGTGCGKGLWCYGGQCVKITKQKPVNVPGGWSEWKTDNCRSGCIEKSLGWQARRRTCDNPSPINSECEGSSYDVVLCKDAKVCNKNQRKPVTTFATAKCKQFAKRLPELDANGAGLQAPHESGRPWMGCAIFCRRSDSGSFYTPRVELNDLGVSPYFPDGTWCHNDSTGNYYCLQHHCLPENFQFTRVSLLHGLGEDIPLPQNAHPHDKLVPPSLKSYLSLGEDGKPLQTTLRPGETKPPNDEDWETNDYVELPHGSRNEISSTVDDNDTFTKNVESIIFEY